MEELTDMQGKVLAFVARFMDDNGAPPTFRDIAEHFGFRSTRAAQDHVAALVRKGKLEHIPGVARGLRLTEEAQGPRADAFAVPLLGQVGASTPREAWQVHMGSLPFPREMARGARDPERELFALRVKGESMIEAGILDGDVVICRAQKTAANGDIVVATIEGESTVKRLHKSGTRVQLIPENRRMKPISISQGELHIQGKVIGVQRFYR